MISSTRQLRPIEKLTRPLIHFLHIEAASGIILLIATGVAMAAANTAFYDIYARFWNYKLTIGVGEWALPYPLWYWVNDGLMTIFFFLVGLEIKREIVSGELRDFRRIISPALAALGGAIVPAIIYLLVLGDQPGRNAWAIPMATDIAFVVGSLALLGKRVPHGLKVFLLTLAIVDDIIAVLIIAIFYSGTLNMIWLTGAFVGIGVVIIMNKLGVRTVIGYLIIGSGIWLCTLKSGIHPTISGVALGFLTPAVPLIPLNELGKGLSRALQVIGKAEPVPETAKLREVVEEVDFISHESISPLERFEADVHPWAAFVIMPIFALTNAGVQFTIDAMSSPISIAVALGLLIGKPLGIILSLVVVVKTRLGILPGGSNWGAVIGAGFLAGIGFTMSLFVASLSTSGHLLVEAKTGILVGSALSGLIGLMLLIVFLRRKTNGENVVN